jgi:uncharacterized membrane protein (DUF441 family)
MNQRIVLIATSMLIALSVLSLVVVFHVGGEKGINLGWTILYIAALFGLLALAFAVRQAAEAWKNVPEKRRSLRALQVLLCVMAIALIPGAFVLFQ